MSVPGKDNVRNTKLALEYMNNRQKAREPEHMPFNCNVTRDNGDAKGTEGKDRETKRGPRTTLEVVGG